MPFRSFRQRKIRRRDAERKCEDKRNVLSHVKCSSLSPFTRKSTFEMIFSGYRDYQSAFDARSTSLSRYEHAAFQPSSSFHRDLPAIVLLLVFLFLIALVFTQILLLYATHPKTHAVDTRNVQQEIRQMEQTIEKSLKKDAATVEQWKSVFNVQSQTNRFEDLLRQNSTANFSTRQTKSRCDEIPANLREFRSFSLVESSKRLQRVDSSTTTRRSCTGRCEQSKKNFLTLNSAGGGRHRTVSLDIR